MDRNENRKPGIPQNDPSKAMDSKKEVEKSNDAKTDQDFPGYPHYPAKEDIMDQRTDMHRVDLDVENLAGGQNKTGLNQRFADEADRQREGMPSAGEENSEDLGVENDTKAINAEIGTPQNVSGEESDENRPGTDLDEEKK